MAESTFIKRKTVTQANKSRMKGWKKDVKKV
jgi:hypothetical protein